MTMSAALPPPICANTNQEHQSNDRFRSSWAAFVANQAKELDLLQGSILPTSVVEFFAEEENLDIVGRLKSYGLQFSLTEEQLQSQSDLLKGITFVISGVFDTISRPELKKMIEDNGGKVSSSISSKTNYLVAGSNMGPSKRTKAEKLGVPIISESDFFEKLQ